MTGFCQRGLEAGTRDGAAGFPLLTPGGLLAFRQIWPSAEAF